MHHQFKFTACFADFIIIINNNTLLIIYFLRNVSK